MKIRTKLSLGATALLFSAVTLSSCTASFCSALDQAHMLFAYDYGVTEYHSTQVEDSIALPGYNNIYVTYKTNETLATINSKALEKGILIPDDAYWITFDTFVLDRAVEAAINDGFTIGNKIITSKNDITAEDITINDAANEKYGILSTYGYLKFYDSNVPEGEKVKLYDNWKDINREVRLSGLDVDSCANTDYISFYQSSLNTTVSAFRSCISTTSGRFGYYGTNGGTFTGPIDIEGKSWAQAWSKGFFEGLLIYPISALVDLIAGGFLNAGIASGVAQIITIFIITIIVRSLMLLFTFKSTQANMKMTELQPELAKIQAKYPNANTSQNEKMRLAEETQKLYKKHGINPFSSIITMLIQFPVFISIWGALSGSSILSTGTFLGLNLSASISSVLFNGTMWTAAGGFGAVTALILFILMSGSQVVSMLLPQWIQKSKTKKVSKLGRNPAQAAQGNKMKMFTYIMMGMIIFMGFSLASGMGVYWFIGALFSIGQTLITQSISKNKRK